MADASVADALCRALQVVCASGNTHCAGLQRAARCLRHRLSARSRRRLRAFDAAAGPLNHVASIVYPNGTVFVQHEVSNSAMHVQYQTSASTYRATHYHCSASALHDNTIVVPRSHECGTGAVLVCYHRCTIAVAACDHCNTIAAPAEFPCSTRALPV